MTKDDPRVVLGVGLEAGDEEIRAAYLQKLKQYPPERSPQQFERIRDAYETLRDPRSRTRHLLFSAEPRQPLASLVPARTSERRFVGVEPWLAMLREGGR
jgi:curved DNA-binding protein CbpA